MKSSYPLPPLPSGWSALEDELAKPYFKALRAFLDRDARMHEIYPPSSSVFRALELTPLKSVRVLILGQDPYHGPGQAHGLAFSVQSGVKVPASLRNMYKELKSDVGAEPPTHGNLETWAKRGVLLLNAVMTVRAGEPNSHRDKGWEIFTDEVIRVVNAKKQRIVFVLWGAYAGKKAGLIDSDRHAIIRAAHPSPLSARNGFFGSKPYSTINEVLVDSGRKPIDWELPEDV